MKGATRRQLSAGPSDRRRRARRNARNARLINIATNKLYVFQVYRATLSCGGRNTLRARIALVPT